MTDDCSIQDCILSILGGQGFEVSDISHSDMPTRIASELAGRVTAATHIELPRDCGEFVAEKRIAKGGMATVYRGWSRRLGRPVAIKIVPRTAPEVGALINEAARLGSMNDDHVVKIVGRGQDQEIAWIAMDFIDGCSLSEFIHGQSRTKFHLDLDHPEQEFEAPDSDRDQPVRADLRTQIGWFKTLAATIGRIGDAGLTHRDIKPGNIMISDKGTPYLVDFGISVDSLDDVAGALAGTIVYMSPEQAIHGFAGVDTRSDVYSLAASFFELVFGRRVVDADPPTPENLRQALLDVPTAKVPDLSATARESGMSGLEEIFQKALAKDRRKRFQTGHELAAVLGDWLDDQGVRQSRTNARSLSLVSIPTAGLILLLGLMAIGWWSGMFSRDKVYNEDPTISRAADLLERQLAGEALDLLTANASTCCKVVRFRDLYARAMAVVGPEMVSRMLYGLAFLVDDGSRNAQHYKLADQARAYMSVGGPQSDLLFVSAFSRFLARRSGSNLRSNACLEELDSHAKLVSRHRLLKWLRILALQSSRDDIDKERARECIAELRRKSTDRMDVKELCLEAYASLQLVEKPDAENLQRLEDQLAYFCPADTSGSPRPLTDRHRLALSFRSLLRSRKGDFAGAAADQEILDRGAISAADRAGCGVRLVRSWIGLAIQRKGDDRAWTEGWRRIRERMKDALAAVPARASLMIAAVGRFISDQPGVNGAIAWYQFLAEHVDGEVQPHCAVKATIQFHDFAVKLFEAKEYDDLMALEESLEALWRAYHEPELYSILLKVRGYLAGSARHLVAEGALDSSQRVDLARRGRRILAPALDVATPDYEHRALDAMLHAHEAICIEDEKQALKEAFVASRSLEVLDSDEAANAAVQSMLGTLGAQWEEEIRESVSGTRTAVKRTLALIEGRFGELHQSR